MMQKKNKSWNKQDIEYVQEHLGRLSFEDMGEHLARSAMSVRLFVLRRRMTPGPLVKRNLLMQMLMLKFRHPEDFSPTKMFYKETGINQRRWWDLYYGRKAISNEEYIAVATYLGITMQQAFESRQLKLFEDESKTE